MDMRAVPVLYRSKEQCCGCGMRRAFYIRVSRLRLAFAAAAVRRPACFSGTAAGCEGKIGGKWEWMKHIRLKRNLLFMLRA